MGDIFTTITRGLRIIILYVNELKNSWRVSDIFNLCYPMQTYLALLCYMEYISALI